jgi:hypothetical protein
MVYSTQDYWVFGFFPSSGVLGSRNTTFRKVDLCPFSGEGEETTTQLGSLERANLNHGPNWVGVFSPPPLHLRTDTDTVSEMSSFYSQKRRTMEMSEPPIILWINYLLYSYNNEVRNGETEKTEKTGNFLLFYPVIYEKFHTFLVKFITK